MGYGMITCCLCGSLVQRTGSTQKVCTVCRAERKLENYRRWYRKPGNMSKIVKNNKRWRCANHDRYKECSRKWMREHRRQKNLSVIINISKLLEANENRPV